MYQEPIEKITAAAEAKAALLTAGRGRYTVAAMLAGLYVGLGILLIFTVGGVLAAAGSTLGRIVMGVCFGVALSLVIAAGAELFTGNNLVMTVGWLRGRVSWATVLRVHLWSLAGNFIGSALLAGLFAYSGLLNGAVATLFLNTAAVKMHLPWSELVIRGLLCNTLVCLAIWCSFRLQSESSKLIMVFWCLFAFITTGFEHNVANMTVLMTALLAGGSAEVSWWGLIYNLFWVTIGNILGGAGVIGTAYWYISGGLRA